MTRTFWIGSNILFDLGTGKTSQVFMLVNDRREASVFGVESEAQTALSFVQRRATNIQWYLEPPTPQRPQGWSIRGEQQIPGR